MLTSLNYARQLHGEEVAAATAIHGNQNRPEQSQTDHAGVPAAAQRFISNPEPSDGSEREKRDLAAQENTATWAFWMVIFTAGQLLLSVAGLWALLRTFRQGQEALEHARQSSRAELRAYLFFQVNIVDPLSAHNSEIKSNWGFVNTGQTPARKMRVITKWAVGVESPPENFFDCEFTDKGTLGYLGSGLDTFVNKSIKLSTKNSSDIQSGKKTLYLFGMAEYEDVFERRHFIKFRRRLHKDGGMEHFYGLSSGQEAT